MCDRLGIVTSVEIPIVNAVTMTPEFRRHCIGMTKEMIWQDYNSPSVVIWAYMNEVLLKPPYDKKDEAAKKEYMAYLYSIASDIENTIRTTDPERYTMLPCHGGGQIYQEAGISSLPMILGWNIYNGWYSRDMNSLANSLERIRTNFPTQSHIVSEYGADVDPRLHSFDSERFDFSCEFGLKYHKHYIKEILARDWLAGAAVWNLNDFYSEGRQDAVPRINNKGITGINREIKDSYWLYKAFLTDTPFIKIGCSTWKYRGGTADAAGICRQKVEVYTNAPEIEMFLDGESLGKQTVTDKVAVFEVPFTAGDNKLMATGKCNGQTICASLSSKYLLDPSITFMETKSFASATLSGIASK